MTRKATIAVTGAPGFVGRAVVGRLLGEGDVVAFSRHARPDHVAIGDIARVTDWMLHLQGVDTIVHLAARVHVMKEEAADPVQAFRDVNVGGTENLARQAARAGVKRLVFVSSIKVNGEETEAGTPFRADDQPKPEEAYARSKWQAEQALHAIGAETGLEIVVIRPPLVYGPGVGANFRAMIGLVRRGIPLPFGAIDNRRSLVAVANLADLIAVACRHPAAAGETFLVSDDDDLSTPELIRRIGRAMGRNPSLLPVAPRWLEAGAALAGKGEMARRLTRSLQADIAKTKQLLDWTPPVTMAAALSETVAALTPR